MKLKVPETYASLPPESRAFVSYMHEAEDQEIVDRLCRKLRQEGVHVFWDRDSLTPGRSWAKELTGTIEAGSCFIACFSRAYGTRPNTYMNEELAVALKVLRVGNRPRTWFIPVRLDDTPLPDVAIDEASGIRDIQAVDLFPDFWDGFNRLLRVVRPPSLAPVEFDKLLRTLCAQHIESKIDQQLSEKVLRLQELDRRWRGLMAPRVWNPTVQATFLCFCLACDVGEAQTNFCREGANPELDIAVTVAPGFKTRPVLRHLDPGAAGITVSRFRDYFTLLRMRRTRQVRLPRHPYSRFLLSRRLASQGSRGWRDRDFVHWIVRFDEVDTGVDLLYQPSCSFFTKCIVLGNRAGRPVGSIYPTSLISAGTMSQTIRALAQQEAALVKSQHEGGR